MIQKIYILLSVTLFISILNGSLSFAQNPQRHFCILTEGQFFAIPLETDLPGICVHGSAVIDSLTLMLKVTGESETQALKALSTGLDCFQLGGKVVYSSDPAFSTTAICSFQDKSFVGALSLGKVPAGHNDQLLKALSQKF